MFRKFCWLQKSYDVYSWYMLNFLRFRCDWIQQNVVFPESHAEVCKFGAWNPSKENCQNLTLQSGVKLILFVRYCAEPNHKLPRLSDRPTQWCGILVGTVEGGLEMGSGVCGSGLNGDTVSHYCIFAIRTSLWRRPEYQPKHVEKIVNKIHRIILKWILLVISIFLD